MSKSRSITLLALLAFGVGSHLLAQPKPNVTGDYLGTLGPLHVKLHFSVGPDGALKGSLDSPDQGAAGIPCADIHLDGTVFSFAVPTVNGTWKGSVESDGSTLKGTWKQGRDIALTFTRDTFVAGAKPSAVDGIWLGKLQAGTISLRAQIKVKSDTSGKEYCSFDSLDQHGLDWQCANVVFAGNDFSFDVPTVHGRWSGKLSSDGKNLTGIWNQGSQSPLLFERQASAQSGAAPALDPAMAPVAVKDLEAVLTRDLAAAQVQVLKVGALAPGTGAGVAIGVLDHGVQRVFTYGSAKPDSIFEIGSITKTFTGLILAQMVLQGKVKFEEPVRELLPSGTVAKPEGTEITLVDLATQHSGLPPMPTNFTPGDKANPYADYRKANLYEFLAKQGVAKPANTRFLYSNLGLGVLGQALSERAGMTYPELLKAQITGPLGMKDTIVSLSAEQQSRFIEGHDAQHHPAHAWDLDALAGAGAIRSTAHDMLTYLMAQLHPDSAKTLSGAIAQSHELRADVGPNMRIALAWLCNMDTGTYWHNGATGGYSSYAMFHPTGDYAVIVLFNGSVGVGGSFADLLGQHIGQRLTGKPAVALGN